MRIFISAMALSGLVLTGCASTPDPAVVCTAEWIQPRTQSAVKAIEKDTRSVIKSLNKSAKSYADGKTPGPFELLRLSNAVDRLSKELKSGQGMRDLRILRDTCNDPDIVSDSLSKFLEDKGLSRGLIDLIQGLEIYQRLISEGADAPSQIKT